MKFFYFIFILFQVFFVNGCPNDCICINTDVRCKHKNLKQVPVDIPVDTVYLDISDNSIKNLTKHSFSKLKSLKALRLERNDMKHIDKDAFVGLESVRDIYLANNDLSNIHEHTFISLKNLLHVYLGGNEFEKIPKLISFSMTRLNIDNNKVRDGYIDKSFLKNTELQTIILTQNHIQKIRENDFIHLKNSQLTSLMLKLNNLQNIHHNAFKPLKGTLMTLELEGNKLLGDKVIESALKGFTGSLKLLMLDLKNCGLKNLSSTFFKPLIYSKLHEIDLSNNPDLQRIDPDAFVGLKRVKILRINRCGLRSSDIKFSAMSLLMELSLTFNGFGVCPFRLPGELKKLHLQNNNIRKIYKYNFKSLSVLEELNLGWNSISEIEAGSFADLVSLKLLDLSFNRLATIESNVLVNMNSLKKLVMMKQNPCLTQLSGDQLRLRKLNEILLNDNCVRKIDNLCVNLPALANLNLTNNHLANLTERTFTKCSELVRLDLSQNYLKYWSDSTFSSMKSLEFLDLSYNKIKGVSTDRRKSNYLPIFRKLKHAKMSNNNWNCTDCNSISWVLFNRDFVSNFDQLMCVKGQQGRPKYFYNMVGNKCSSSHRVNNNDDDENGRGNKKAKSSRFKNGTIVTVISLISVFITCFCCCYRRRVYIRRWFRERCGDYAISSLRTTDTIRRHLFSNRLSRWSNSNRNDSRADLINNINDDDLIDNEVGMFNNNESPKLILMDPINPIETKTNIQEKHDEESYDEIGSNNDLESYMLTLPRPTSDQCDFVIYCPNNSCNQCKPDDLESTKFNLNYNYDVTDLQRQSNIIYASNLIIHITSLNSIEKNYYHHIKDLLLKKQEIANASRLFIYSKDQFEFNHQSNIEAYFGVPIDSFGDGYFETYLYKLL